MPIRFAKLPLTLPLSGIQAETGALTSTWKAHLNTAHYQGNWTVLSLRSPGGNPDHIAADALGHAAYADTPLMKDTPVLKSFLDSLPFPLWSVRLLRLAPGSLIKEHRDPELCFEQGEVRLHFPLHTHEEVEFVVDGERVRMQEGECWYINANLPHRVSNPGPGERIHLVVDGPVTPELRALFAQAVVSYSPATAAAFEEQLAVIRELRLQGTETADRLASQLEDALRAADSAAEGGAHGTAPDSAASGGGRAAGDGAAATAAALRNWIPSALVRREGEWLCRWLDAGDVPFTDPFFDETLNICRNRPGNRRAFQVLGSVPSMREWADAMPAVPPSAFIFHVSRCGSTLAAQLLGLDPAHIALAEVPFIDDLLRAAYREPGAPLPDLEAALRAAFRFYGQQRHGGETRLFVKADSWHIFFYPILRSVFPQIPFFLLYRSPEAVLYSHRKRRGMQAVPGIIEREILWAPEEAGTLGRGSTAAGDLDAYMASVLDRYMERFLRVAAADPLAHLVNYAEGIPAIVERIAGVTHTTLSPALMAQMEERTRFHAKFPEQVFSEEVGTGLPGGLMGPLLARYDELEQKRLGTGAGKARG